MMSLDLVTRLLLDIFHLSTACDSPSSHLKLLPLQDMFDVAFGGLISNETIESVLLAFASNEERQQLSTTLNALNRAIDAAGAQDSTLFEHLGRAADALDVLHVMSSITHSSALSDVCVSINSPIVFRFFRYFMLSSSKEQPEFVLVGSIASTEKRLGIPLSRESLDRIQLGYDTDDPHPRWKTDLWVRLPPDPYKRRFTDWLPDEFVGADTIELYRRQIPGEGPVTILSTERVEYPRMLSTPRLELRLEPANSQVYGWRTTVQDKYRAPLLIAERVVLSP